MAQRFISSLSTELDILLKNLPIAALKLFQKCLRHRHSDSTKSIQIH